MVQAQYNSQDPSQQPRYIATKIDHGRSFIEFHKDFGAMVNSTFHPFNHMGYLAGINSKTPPGQLINGGNFQCNAMKYSEALQQMLSQFNKDTINNIVDKKVDELKKSGFDPKNIQTTFRFDSTVPNQYLSLNLNSFKDISSNYKNLLTRNLENMKRIAKDVEVVVQFSNVSPHFRNGGWIEAFAGSPLKDPIIFAVEHGIQIGGKNPFQWALENNRKVDLVSQVNTKQNQIEDKVTQSADPTASLLYYYKAMQKPLAPFLVNFLNHAISKNLRNTEGEYYINLAQRYGVTISNQPNLMQGQQQAQSPQQRAQPPAVPLRQQQQAQSPQQRAQPAPPPRTQSYEKRRAELAKAQESMKLSQANKAQSKIQQPQDVIKNNSQIKDQANEIKANISKAFKKYTNANFKDKLQEAAKKLGKGLSKFFGGKDNGRPR